MFKIIREVDIGDINESHIWGAVMKECDTKDEAIKYINEQPRWLQRELRVKEEN